MMSVSIYGQNILSGVYSRGDSGFGLRYDREFKTQSIHGIYASTMYGIYTRPTINPYKHIKMQAGYVRYLRNNVESYWQIALSAGLNGHYYREIDYEMPSVEKRALFPVSGDVGTMVILDDRLVMGWIFDIMKYDVAFNLGYRFGIYEKRTRR
jgi:hypothetical protein